MAGAIAGGVVSGHFAGFQGVKGGGWNNLVAEMAHGTVRGAWAGGIGGMASSGLSGQNMLPGFFQGARSGATAGAAQAGMNIFLFGVVFDPEFSDIPSRAREGLRSLENDMASVGNGMGAYGPIYRSGGLMKYIAPKGFAYGRNIGIIDRSSVKQFLHETTHYYQQIYQGYAKYLARGAYEQTWNMLHEIGLFGLSSPYSTSGTQEYAADLYYRAYR